LVINYDAFIWIGADIIVVILTQIYNDRRLFFGGGPGVVPNDTFGSVASSPNADRRSSRGRGMLLLTYCIFNLIVSFFLE
jgi:hypothetical protein